MASTLGITQVAAAQNQKEVTINEADQALEDLSSLTIDLTITTHTTLSASQYRSGIRFRLGGTPAADFDLRLRANERLFIVTNNTGKTATVGVDPAADGFDGDTVAVFDGQTVLIACDGVDCIIVSIGGPGNNADEWGIVMLTGTAETLQASYMGKVVVLTNASPITLTVEDFATVPIGVNKWVRIVQGGAGTVTVIGSGATINSMDSVFDLAGAWAGAVLYQMEEDSWLLEGNLA